MKKISIATALLYSVTTLAQISYGTGTIEEKTVVVEAKIPVYDSLSNFKIENKFDNYKQYIGFQFYLPKAISENPKPYPPILYSYNKKIAPNVDEMRGSYFTLLDVILPDNKTTYFVCCVMKNDKSGDTVCWKPTQDGDFILVPYYIKQRKLFLNKSFVDVTPTYRTEDGDRILNEIDLEKNRWTCKEVTLKTKTSLGFMKDEYGRYAIDRYVICYVFVNGKNETMPMTKSKWYNNKSAEKDAPFGSSFITEDEYNKREQERMKKEQSEQLRRSTRDAKSKEDDKAKYAEYVKKYGQANADLIVKRKVVVGMTEEMCIYSWGPFYTPSKVVNDQGTFETWHYSATSFLYFVNGILKEIQQ